VGSETKLVHWGIVGLGSVVTNRFAPALVQRSRFTIAGCSGRTPERAAAFGVRFEGSRTYPDFDARIADPAIDVVYVATPNSLHHLQARAALAAGKHVLCENPLELVVATSNGQCVETIKASSLFAREIDAFEDEVAGRPTSPASAEDGLNAITVADAIRQSLERDGELVFVAQQ